MGHKCVQIKHQTDVNMAFKLKLFVILFTVVCISAEYISYKDYKVYKITPESENELAILKKVEKENEFFFWMEVGKVGRDVRIMVRPDKQNKFEKYMANLGLKPFLFIDDVQR